MPSGTHTVADLQQITNQTAVQFGLDALAEVIRTDLDLFNTVNDELFQELATPTMERQEIYGASVDGEMEKADEYDRAVAVKVSGGSNVGYPLEKLQKAVGWTYDSLRQTSVQQIVNTVLAVQLMYQRSMRKDILRALFRATNYTARDRFVAPQMDIPVKRLLNADSASIPNGLQGQSFDAATHTHYDWLASATPTAAALLALMEDVLEHGHSDGMQLNVHRSAEATIRAMSGDFVPYVEAGIIPGSATTYAQGTLDTSRVTNRAIGQFHGAEVWTREWVPSGYVFAFAAGDPRKPLAYRQHPILKGLQVVANNQDYPLYADVLAGYYGFGVKTRTNGAVLYYNAAASGYVEPTI